MDSIRLRVARWLFLVLLLLPVRLAAAQLTGISIAPGVLTISADGPPAAAFQFSLSAPYRLVLYNPASVTEPTTVTGAGSVVRVRAAMFEPGMARLVMDLSRPLEIISARNSAGGLTITFRRIDDTAFAANVEKGRQPLPVLSGGPAIAAVPKGVGPGQLAAGGSPATALPRGVDSASGGGFELPEGMFSGGVKAQPSPPGSAAPSLQADEQQTPERAGTGPQPAASASAAEQAPRRRPGIRPRSGAMPLVVIDAGHGGKDVGSISIDGRYEKDVTLAIALETARTLGRRGKVKVKLTRSDDRFIPLGGRVAIARAAKADLFVSVHADSAPNALAQGASVYTLSSVASDAVAARLAARENKADIIGGINLGVMSADVGEIMIDLSRRATGNVSVAFADVLQETLSDKIRFRGEFHHFAGFFVLKAPDVPSVLFETGYISNTEDAQFLVSRSGQKTIAEGIARAIERHLLGD